MNIQQVSSFPSSGSLSSARADAGQAVAAPGASPEAKPAANTQMNAGQIEDAVGKVNKVVQAMGNDLMFAIDRETGIHVVKVVEQSTNKVIQQFPSKQILAIAQSLDQLQGLLVKQKV